MTAPTSRFAWLSIVAALVTIGLKYVAYELTGSVGMLSDAIESFVNLAGGIMALLMLKVAARPADADHTYGHSKAEYFSSGVEGGLILLAACSIGWAAIGRIFHPVPLESIGMGLGVSIGASLINLLVALIILRAARVHRSITLESNAHHLLTDVWTSVGVVAAIALVSLTGWQWLDPVVALAVAANIIGTGVKIVRRSAAGLMDTALEPDDMAKVQAVLAHHEANGVQFHALRTRQAGVRKFVSLHVLVPGAWTIQRGHDLTENIEADLRNALRDTSVTTHLEPIEDPASWEDIGLDRRNAPNPSQATSKPNV
jgi:cation diffusion facilitator family transporter